MFYRYGGSSRSPVYKGSLRAQTALRGVVASCYQLHHHGGAEILKFWVEKSNMGFFVVTAAHQFDQVAAC